MKNLDKKLQSYIDELLTIARPNLIAADKAGAPDRANEVVKEYAQVAHHVYGALDVPNRKPELYHDPKAPRVLLDPMTVLNRAKNREDGIDDLAFWQHIDMLKTLCDYLDLRFGGSDAKRPSRK